MLLLLLLNFGKTGRKLLKSKSSDEFIVPDHNNLPREERNDSVFLSAPKNVGVAASGAFLLCCVFVCPCFYKKWRETAENTLTKEPNSSESFLLSYILLYVVDYKLVSRGCLSNYNEFVLVCKWSENC